MKAIHFRKPTKRELVRLILNSLIIVFGNAMAAFASAIFVIPNGFVMGGTTGVGILVRNLIPETVAWREWAVSITVYAVNIGLFILGAVLLGKKFAVATFAGTVLYPSFLSLFTLVNDAYVAANGAPVGASEPVLAALIGGLLFGFGVGIVVRVGASTGGTDIPPLILHKFFEIPVSVTLWALDFSIVLLQFFGASVDAVLFGVLITLLSSYIVDKVALIGMRRTQVKIVSEHYEEIREMILTKISRGVTVLYGQTGYLKKDCHMILTIISHRQLVPLKAAVQSIDPHAFMTISVVSEVRGEGFHSDGVDFLIPEKKGKSSLFDDETAPREENGDKNAPKE